MARPFEPPIGTKERLELARSRYLKTYLRVRRHLREGRPGWGSLTRAIKAAATDLDEPYDTVKKHYLRMKKNLQASRAAGVAWSLEDEEVTEYKEPEFIAAALRLLEKSGDTVIHRTREQQDEEWVQDAQENLFEFAFTPEERRHLKRVP